MRKVALHNLGCKVNSYETDAMEQMLAKAGYEIVKFGEELADIYIINTCSVTNIADRKSRQMLHKAKKMNPDAVVIATGCYVQAEGENIQKDEAVDIVIGNNRKNDLLQVIDNYYQDQNNNMELIDINKEKEYEEMSIDSVYEHTRAYIKIQDGCNQFCSYCIIPYTRGRVRSRDKAAVINEVKKIVENGYQEVVLTGIHLSSYGIDQGEEEGLLNLIYALNDIEGLKRIRLGSLEPRIVTENFASTISKLDKMCPHFHLSLQSGCDATLKRMNRKYDTAEYYEKCELLRKYFDNPAITTDVIVGFPEETQEEFEITKEFLEKVHFYEMHIFKYSRRKGTVADKMEKQVDDSVKNDRSKVLLQLEKKMSDEFRTQFIGATKAVLFEEEITIQGKEYVVGHTMEYLKVILPLENGNEAEQYINKIINVSLEKVMEKGEILGFIK